eukprot:TRINITY_DN36958_c0_g1_i1.p1 TRINITY_DN36958_c0_g1~~TRINITY_DN36958_c0_g1_i1.p1  ORF type:complete len:934 (-),score=124.59 TRINITY_DN36958_c0_g1_i1:70-2871(-)
MWRVVAAPACSGRCRTSVPLSFSFGAHRGFAPPIPSRIKDAVPLRRGKPKVEDALDVMVVGLCPHKGSGVVRFRWQTKKIVVREFLIDGGLPGEVVTVRFGLIKEKKYPFGELEIYVNPDVTTFRRSPYETRSPCPHFESCGGCDFLNLRYGRQLVEKQRWVERALAELKAPATLRRIRPSEPQQRFAHRTEWRFSEFDGDFSIGPVGTEVDERLADEAAAERAIREFPSACLRPPRSVVRVLEAAFEAFRKARTEARSIAYEQSSVTTVTALALPRPAKYRPAAYSIYEEKRGMGVFRSLAVIAARPPRDQDKRWIGTELLLNIILADEVEDATALLDPIVCAAIEAVGPERLVGVVANLARSKRAIMGGRRELLLHGRRYARQAFPVSIPVHGVDVKREFVLHLGSGSRLPVHTRALPELAKTVAAMCNLSETDTVWHCFCGGGELGLALGVVSEHVVAIGTSAAEVSELKRTLAANDVTNTTTVLANLRSPWTLKQLSFHIAQSQQRRLLLGTGDEQEKAREYAVSTFVPGEGRRAQLQRLSATPFTAPLLREDAMAHRELRTLLPAFVRDFRSSNNTTLPVPATSSAGGDEERTREVPEEMESRLKRLYRRLALKYHPDKNPDDPEASERFQALNRAYKALVGDKAGPEEGDDEAKDPFLVAKFSSYKPKFKDRWRVGEEKNPGGIRRASQRESYDSASGDAGEDADGDTDFGTHDDGAAQGDMGIDADEEEEDDDDDDVAVGLEIDDAWASPSSEPSGSFEQSTASTRRPASKAQDVVLSEGAPGLSALDGGVAPPTLPPPDVIVVSQPRHRKPGRGTPRYFHSWLRSTAARAIIYVAVDMEAFTADAKRLTELGYRLQESVPFDADPHRRSLLMVARFELVRPLIGSEDYGPGGDVLLAGSGPLLPGSNDSVPMLGGGGYTAIPPSR